MFEDPEFKTENLPDGTLKKAVGVFDFANSRLEIVVGCGEILETFVRVAKPYVADLVRKHGIERVVVINVYEPVGSNAAVGGLSDDAMREIDGVWLELITRLRPKLIGRPVGRDRFLAIAFDEREVLQGRIDILHWLRHYSSQLYCWLMGIEGDKKSQKSIRDSAEKEQTWEDLTLPRIDPRLMSVIRDFNGIVEAFRSEQKANLQKALDNLAKDPVTFQSAEEKHVFASLLTQLLSRLGLRLKCQLPNCGEAAVLRGGRYGGTKHGVFQFQHPVGGKGTTHVATSGLPRLELVEMPDTSLRKTRFLKHL
ncbi:MAG: hypothetical protein GDA67_16695 [Nitrospira sp. CR1.3]|nr:hypothetical protein [Nitrospira sp. CR1.3]